MSKVSVKIAGVVSAVMTAELENQGINVETPADVVEFMRLAIAEGMLEDWFIVVPSEDGEATLMMEDVIFAIENGDLNDNAVHVFSVMAEQVKQGGEDEDVVIMGVTHGETGESYELLAGDLYALVA
ncbi:hypothetical protein [Providencia phage PSTCR5]|uniref:Uncharacterized protein n=1 Tax=Providencia phage PSTCR5 TaxID=2783547 RepID=A0A873WNN5_9CAUD|nr:hypothetical protein KNV68_gp129 [Providencia phage PSTCR5]QPB12229.1 hypothetical protein [Providencia phage PSTCR5]